LKVQNISFVMGLLNLAHHTPKKVLNLWSNAYFGGENLALDHTKKGANYKGFQRGI
jgi:hypothetical protein